MQLYMHAQEDLLAEEDLCQEELAVQRNAKLQELQHELNAKAQQSHEAQQTIRSQVQQAVDYKHSCPANCHK